MSAWCSTGRLASDGGRHEAEGEATRERVPLPMPNTRGVGVTGYKVGKRTLWVPGNKPKVPPPD